MKLRSFVNRQLLAFTLISIAILNDVVKCQDIDVKESDDDSSNLVAYIVIGSCVFIVVLLVCTYCVCSLLNSDRESLRISAAEINQTNGSNNFVQEY